MRSPQGCAVEADPGQEGGMALEAELCNRLTWQAAFTQRGFPRRTFLAAQLRGKVQKHTRTKEKDAHTREQADH